MGEAPVGRMDKLTGAGRTALQTGEPDETHRLRQSRAGARHVGTAGGERQLREPGRQRVRELQAAHGSLVDLGQAQPRRNTGDGTAPALGRDVVAQRDPLVVGPPVRHDDGRQ